MKQTFKLLSAAAALTAFAQLAAQADTSFFDGTFPASGRGGNSPGSVGFEFSLDNAASLDSLGVLDQGQAASVEVGLFNTSGLQLADAVVVVPGTAGDAGNFDYSTALTYSNGFTGVLAASTDYILQSSSNVENFQDHSTFSTSAGTTLVEAMYNSDATFDVLNTNAGAGQAYVGPNFTFSPATTPEPSTFALLGAGLLVLILAQRHKSVSR